ncbi:MAG TPA: VOC family protein [Candidatus Kryptonia bacterium]
MAAPVTHFEVNAKDAKRAQDFYSNLFGWKIAVDPTMNYGLVDTGVKMGINGGIGPAMPNAQPNVTFYVQVEDAQAYLDKAVSLGGKVVFPLTEVPGMVTYAQFADPEGNVVGIIKGPQTPPKEAKPKKTAPKRKKAAKPKRKVKRGKK